MRMRVMTRMGVVARVRVKARVMGGDDDGEGEGCNTS